MVKIYPGINKKNRIHEMRLKYDTVIAFSFPTPCLLLPLILLSLSVIPSATIISSSSPVIASVEDNRGDDGDDGNDDDIDLDELNLLQVCCAWSDKISDGVLEYRISDEGDEDSKQSVRNAIQDWNLLI